MSAHLGFLTPDRSAAKRLRAKSAAGSLKAAPLTNDRLEEGIGRRRSAVKRSVKVGREERKLRDSESHPGDLARRRNGRSGRIIHHWTLAELGEDAMMTEILRVMVEEMMKARGRGEQAHPEPQAQRQSCHDGMAHRAPLRW